jgi:hypothetical protein
MFPTLRANKWLMVACLAVAGLFQAAPVLAQ